MKVMRRYARRSVNGLLVDVVVGDAGTHVVAEGYV